MKVILNDFVQHLGNPGEEIDVAPGYARNYLIPKNIAFVATPGNKKTYENNLKHRARKLARLMKDAEALKGMLEGMETLVFIRKAGDEGKLFGSVTTSDIEEALKQHGHSIDRKKIELDHAIKSVGEYEAVIRINPKVSAAISLEVRAEVAEAPAAYETPAEAPVAE